MREKPTLIDHLTVETIRKAMMDVTDSKEDKDAGNK